MFFARRDIISFVFRKDRIDGKWRRASLSCLLAIWGSISKDQRIILDVLPQLPGFIETRVGHGCRIVTDHFFPLAAESHCLGNLRLSPKETVLLFGELFLH